MAEFDSVLVYDGDCPFCSAAATALRQLPEIGTVAWNDDAAQAFLEAQFDETPFALVLADPASGQVYLGREAASEVAERAGMPVLVQDILGDNYESLADAVRTVTGVERDPDPYHGVYPLSDAARERFDDLAANAYRAPGTAGQFTRG